MIVIPTKPTVFCDIDDTIALWSPTQEQLDEYGVEITCPGSSIEIDGQITSITSWTEKLVPHRKHIEQLKKHKMRGHIVVLWSAGGADWCAAVAKAFNLENIVDLCISKPNWAYDDLQPNEFIPKPIWLKDE